jgi:flagellin-like hook-associated protein FlgL
MARRPTTPTEVPDALREAVEQTVQAARDSAQGTRSRAQGALDELVETLERSRSAVIGALEDRRPANQDDVKELKAELRKISRRLDAIEERLPAKTRAPAKKRSSSKK